MTKLDPRLHAFRDDLADARLRGSVAAARYSEGEEARIAVPVVKVRQHPEATAGTQTEWLFGDRVRVFDRAGGWCWVQSLHDSYTGYVEEPALAEHAAEPDHIVTAPRTFVYPEAELRRPPLAALSMGSRLAVAEFLSGRGTRYARLQSGGFVFAGHIHPASFRIDDYVEAAEQLLETPYLWGGTSAFGIDCSGLVQLAMRMAGHDVLRDSDMQEASFGIELGEGEGVRRGDLLFWKGHVAIVSGENEILHANGFTMQVSREKMDAALARIAAAYGPPTRRRRWARANQ